MHPPRPHLLARSRFAELADRAMAASWRGPNQRPPLEPDFLWTKGSAGFSAEDECFARGAKDVADFRERIAVLCEALGSEARLNALGHAAAYGQLKAAIRTRHRLGKLWREQPGLLRTELAPPIIVVGQMRAGTTRMHRLLASDPRHAGTRLCNSIEPVPRFPDIRPLRCALGLALARRVNPWIDTLHPFGATRVDEELGWLSAALSPCAYEAQWRIPSFVSFSEARDPAPAYREFARMLRTDAATMGNAAMPRVLKCPQYAEDLPALLAQFPDAKVVVTRRDLDAVLSSTVSVVASQMAWQSDHASLDWIESEWRRKLALRDERSEEALARFTFPVSKVEFAALDADWESEIERVYRDLGLPFSDEARAAMRAEQRRAGKSPHLAHKAMMKELGSAQERAKDL
jgi:hypothetical protein